MTTHPSPHPSRAVALVLVAGVLLGTAGTASDLGPDAATATALGGLRLTGGAVVLLAVMPWLGGAWRRVPGLVRHPRVWAMAVGAAAYQPLFFGAVERTGVALSTLVTVGAGPVFTGLLGWALLRHRPTAAWTAATALAILGLVLRSWGDLDVDDAVGLSMAAGAGFGSSVYVVAAKSELDRGGHAVELPGTAYLIGSFLLAPLVLAEPLGWVGTPGGVALVLYLGVVTMAVANVFLVLGIRGLPPGPAATLSLADPLTATVLGVLVLDESIRALGWLGLLLVLVALVLQGLALRRAPSSM